MTSRVVHIECGKPPSECDCPASVKRPFLRCVIQPKPSQQTTPPPTDAA